MFFSLLIIHWENSRTSQGQVKDMSSQGKHLDNLD